jgi:hypothetical protein
MRPSRSNDYLVRQETFGSSNVGGIGVDWVASMTPRPPWYSVLDDTSAPSEGGGDQDMRLV